MLPRGTIYANYIPRSLALVVSYSAFDFYLDLEVQIVM